MKKNKLGKFIKQIRGISYKPHDISNLKSDSKIPIVKANNITEDGFDDNGLIFIDTKKVKKEQLILKGDIVLAASSGSKKIIGKNIQFDDDYKASFGAFCKLIRSTERLDAKYLYHFLKTPYYRRTIENAVQGANINNLKNQHLDDMLIPIPEDYDDQTHIATILSSADNLIAKRKESIELLDELLKSTFLEMFGDPVRNEMGWEKEIFDTFSESRLGKMRDKQFITGTHLRKYIGNSNVQWFRFIFDDLLEMDFNSKERNTFHLNDGDLLICEGGEIGRCAIWKSSIEDCYFQKALHRVRLDLNRAIPEYIQYVMLFYSLRNGFKNVTSKATIAHLTGVKLKATSVPLPPIVLQNKFARIVEKVESIKSKYKQSLTELENLYGALSQRAFKGELDLSKIPIKEKPEPIAGTADITLPAMKMEGEITVQKPFSNQKLLKVKKRTRTLIMK